MPPLSLENHFWSENHFAKREGPGVSYTERQTNHNSQFNLVYMNANHTSPLFRKSFLIVEFLKKREEPGVSYTAGQSSHNSYFDWFDLPTPYHVLQLTNRLLSTSNSRLTTDDSRQPIHFPLITSKLVDTILPYSSCKTS